MRMIVALAGLIVLAGSVGAGEFNSVLSIGDAAPAWKDLEGVDGKKHALADLKGKDVVVIAFICNSCATVTSYEDRINAFVEKFCGQDGKAGFVAISVSNNKEDLLPKMKERAEKKKYKFPHLHDPSQEIAKAYGAKTTPEFFVLNKDRKVVYTGAMDDKSKAEDVKVNYLVPAVEAALGGKAAAKGEAPAIGCRIRFVPMKEK